MSFKKKSHKYDEEPYKEKVLEKLCSERNQFCGMPQIRRFELLQEWEVPFNYLFLLRHGKVCTGFPEKQNIFFRYAPPTVDPNFYFQ